MQKGKDSLMMSGSQGLQGFFPCILPGLFLPIPGIQDSLGVAQTGLWVSPPWRETVKCYSPAQPCVPVASPSSFSINSSARTPDNANFPQDVSKPNSIHTGQLQQCGTRRFCPSVPPASPSCNSYSQHWATGGSFSRFSFKCTWRHLCFKFAGM